MVDEPGDVPSPDDGRVHGGRPPQRNFAERLFPGPTPEMTDQFRERIEGLITQRKAAHPTRPDRPTRPISPGSSPNIETAPAATSDDVTRLSDTLDQQTELLRAILASSVDAQADARSTAQNSRTFAWAGTAIAVLTLVATVISIVAVIQAH